MRGKTVISTDCPTGPAEILDHGRAGLLTPVGDVEALADAMHRVLTDKELNNRLIEEGLRHRRLFMPEQSIADFNRLIES